MPQSNYSYGYDKDTLHIRIKTKKGEVKKLILELEILIFGMKVDAMAEI